MSAPPYMPLYPADYLADTTHLTRSEHGAYLLLLMAMWRAGGRLPNNEIKLAKLAQCSAEEWDEIREVILEFFHHRGGHLLHKRVTKEMAKYENRICNARKAGIQSASKRANKINEIRSTDVQPKINQPEPEPEPESIKKERGPRKSRRCPPNFEFDDSVFDTGEKAGLTADQIEQELTKLEDYEFKTARSDWNAVARNWLRSAKPTKPKGPQIDYAAMERRHQQWKRQQAEAESIASDGGWGEVPI